MRDTGIATRLRLAGLRVIEVAGWQTRGPDTLNPRGSVNHHTAGGNSGTIPSLRVLIDGKAGVSGPLCNVAQSREPDGNDIFYVIGAGKANHAGLGSWHGVSGNSSMYGLEIEHVGTTPLPDHRQRLAARCHAALIQGRASAEMVCQHREWAPGRKIDAATNVDPNRFRQWVAEALAVPAPIPPSAPEEAELMVVVKSNDNKHFLLGPGLCKEITAERAIWWTKNGARFDNNGGPGYAPLEIVSFAQDVGIRFQ